MAGFLSCTFDFPVRIDPRTERSVDLAYTNGLLTNVTGYGTLSYQPNLLIHQVTHGNGVVETWSNDPNSMRRPRSITATGRDGQFLDRGESVAPRGESAASRGESATP